MPATSKRQQGFFGAELSRKRRGKATVTGLAESQIREFAATKTGRLPEVARSSTATMRRRMKGGK